MLHIQYFKNLSRVLLVLFAFTAIIRVWTWSSLDSNFHTPPGYLCFFLWPPFPSSLSICLFTNRRLVRLISNTSQSCDNSSFYCPKDQQELVFHYFPDLLCHCLPSSNPPAIVTSRSSVNASGVLLASLFSCDSSFCLWYSTPDYKMATLLTCFRISWLYHFLRDSLLRNALSNSFKIVTTPLPRPHYFTLLFHFLFYWRIIDILYISSFRCTSEWFHIFVHYEIIPTISQIAIC